MSTRPNLDLATADPDIPALADVAQELNTLMHCAREPYFRDDDKVVRCLKAAIMVALKEAEMKGFTRAVAAMEIAVAKTKAQS